MEFKRIIFASNNQGKIKEMKDILKDSGIAIISASEAGIKEEVEEDGSTFLENAKKKADFVSGRTGEWAVADDTGLCIEALNGAPGVFSARWAGENKSDQDLVDHALKKLEGVPEEKRRAWFESVVVLSSPRGEYWPFDGRIYGTITASPQGKMRTNLPYDLIFVPDGHKVTFAQMSSEEKNALSHRGKAFQEMNEFIKNNINHNDN